MCFYCTTVRPAPPPSVLIVGSKALFSKKTIYLDQLFLGKVGFITVGEKLLKYRLPPFHFDIRGKETKICNDNF